MIEPAAGDVVLSRELRSGGYGRSEIARLERQGSLTHLRRGAWTSQTPTDRAALHRQLIAATLPLVSADAVLSHASAGVLHGLPTWSEQLGTVHWTRSRRGGGRSRRQIHVYAAALQSDEITTIDGTSVTTLARTVIDIGRHSPFRHGVAVADAAIRLGLDHLTMLDAAERARHRPGGGQARRVAQFADGRAETPGESWSRVELSAIGWPPSQLQYEVFDGRGRLVGRTDFCWEALRVLGEFDGKTKYGRELNGPTGIEDVLFAEKRREDALRDLDWQMVRWVAADLARPELIRDRLERAARRSRSSLLGLRRTR